jgi:hypothetical protein
MTMEQLAAVVSGVALEEGGRKKCARGESGGQRWNRQDRSTAQHSRRLRSVILT